MEISPEKLADYLGDSGTHGEKAAEIGGKLGHYEDELLRLYAMSPDANTTQEQINKKIEQNQFLYQKAMRVYEAFQTLMKNAHEIMMRAIQNLAVR